MRPVLSLLRTEYANRVNKAEDRVCTLCPHCWGQIMCSVPLLLRTEYAPCVLTAKDGSCTLCHPACPGWHRTRDRAWVESIRTCRAGAGWIRAVKSVNFAGSLVCVHEPRSDGDKVGSMWTHTSTYLDSVELGKVKLSAVFTFMVRFWNKCNFCFQSVWSMVDGVFLCWPAGSPGYHGQNETQQHFGIISIRSSPFKVFFQLAKLLGF